MKTYQKSFRLATVAFLFTIAAFVTSCKKDADPISGEVSATVTNEATQDAQQDEVDDMVTAQLNVSDNAGRMAAGDDQRVTCAQITFTANNADKLSGTLVIDFDHKSNGDANPDGCTDARGNVRKGKITVTWAGGRWYKVGSVITITLNNYSINGVVISGSRVLSNITSNVLLPTWTIVAEHSATWPDGHTATRTVHKTRQWDIVGGTLTVTQTAGTDSAASGTTRGGVSYTVQITQGLVYKFSCIGSSKVYVAVSGIKVITFNSKVVTIDFGTGDCDNTFTLSFDGKTRTITVKNDSSAD